ncbi:PRC-barrel domain-containing protein [Rhodobacteraceae bacterium D3-12]|nr:PRC-barrel domain-containing protein [Rhodobacteraceae bacterium D3-12]
MKNLMMTTALITFGASAAIADSMADSTPLDKSPEAAKTEMTDKDPAMKAETKLDIDGFAAAEQQYITAETLTGTEVYDSKNVWIGEVSEVLMTDDMKVEKAVIDVGGFLGIGEKPVALELDKLNVLRSTEGDDMRVHVTLSKAELEAMDTYGK